MSAKKRGKRPAADLSGELPTPSLPDEQELLRRLARKSRLPVLELDLSDYDLPRAADRVADWLEATGGLHLP